jgi:AcrR family transcriptional regulator
MEMGISERKRRERERIRGTILKAAKELFYRHDYHHVSMRKIAQKIEYSPTTIYHYFKNKDDLLTHIIRDYFDDFLVDVEDILQNKEIDPFTTLHNYLLFYARRSLENSQEYQFLSNIFSAQEKLTIGNTNAHVCYLQIKELIQKCIDNKVFQDRNVEMMTQSIWSVLYGLTVLLTSRPNFNWTNKEELIAFTIQLHLNGLK